MKKFEEDFDKKVRTFDVVGHHNGVCCLVEEVKAFGKNWVSPEDHQAKVDELNKKIDWLHGLLAEKISEIVNGVKDSTSIEFTLRRYELKSSKLKASEYNNLEITVQALGCSVEELVEE